MDRVRFGRALGYGARHAAKSLVQAAQAVAAKPSEVQAPVRAVPTPATVQKTRARGPLAPVGDAGRQAARAKRASRSFFAPIAHFSSVVGLQVAGTFFALIALAAGDGLWRLRGSVHEGLQSSNLQHFVVFTGVFLLFGYFAISSFVRASRRQPR